MGNRKESRLVQVTTPPIEVDSSFTEDLSYCVFDGTWTLKLLDDKKLDMLLSPEELFITNTGIDSRRLLYSLVTGLDLTLSDIISLPIVPPDVSVNVGFNDSQSLLQVDIDTRIGEISRGLADTIFVGAIHADFYRFSEMRPSKCRRIQNGGKGLVQVGKNRRCPTPLVTVEIDPIQIRRKFPTRIMARILIEQTEQPEPEVLAEYRQVLHGVCFTSSGYNL